MTVRTLRISDKTLREASPQDREQHLRALIKVATTGPRSHASLDARLSAFEQRYGMSSAQMMERVSAGAVRETEDISDWLLLFRLRNELKAARPR